MAMLPMVLLTACSDDDDEFDYSMIEGSWGLVHSQGFDKEDMSEPLEWNFNCNPLAPSSFDDYMMDIVKIDGNKYYQIGYFWSTFSKRWIEEDEGYTFTINGNTITPVSNGEEYNDAGFKILNLTSTSMTIEVKKGSTYYSKAIYKKLN